MRKIFLAGASALAFVIALQAGAHAAVIQVLAPQQFSATPINFTIGTGTFSLAADPTSYSPMSTVATSGSGLVTSFFGDVAEFSVDAQIDNTGLFTFAASPTPASLTNSSALDFFGFSYNGTNGVHYGYAEVFGATFVGYAYESVAGASITVAEVPEPASMAVLISGLVAVGLARRGKRSSAQQEFAV